MHRYLLLSCLVLPLSLAARTGFAGEPLNAIEGVAMDGFDVVAYFMEGKPRKGIDAHRVEYKGQTWKFASPSNAQDFRDNPKIYEPQFNGWCAYAVSEGYAAEVDFIDGWSVLDGKLYLNWSASIRDTFVAEQDQRRANAAANWPGVRAGILDGSVRISRHKRLFGVGIKHPQELPE